MLLPWQARSLAALIAVGRPRVPATCSPVMTAAAAATAPSWETLRSAAHATPTGARLLSELSDRERGDGPAHTDAKLRLFGASPESVRVTLYRDTAAWCPYCQKVWLLLEEKRIPYRIEKINMRSYGDKPSDFLRRVPGGLLPALELDGRFMTDSLPIMATLDAAFPQEPLMIPPEGSAARQEAESLLRLERELFSAWCRLTFSPGKGIFDAHEKNFLETLGRFEQALGKGGQTRDGESGADGSSPWLLGGESPTLVDLQYVSHVERMVASVLYWKGLELRDNPRFPNLERWLSAFERRPSYVATKSDWYTHVQDIPPQYGPGYAVKEAAHLAAAIDGGSWHLPLTHLEHLVEKISPLEDVGETGARHEAAFKLSANHANVVRFAARGSGTPGRPQFQAPLADPNAVPDESVIDAVDVALRCVTEALLNGADAAEASAQERLGGYSPAEAEKLTRCLHYLRDRVGVPRDMGVAAAMHLRGTLNWAAALAKPSK